MTDTHEDHGQIHWTYTVGNYRSFLYWPTFEAACDAAFADSPDVTEAHVFTPSGPGANVRRSQWEEWQR